MPYILRENRETIDHEIDALATKIIQALMEEDRAGALNYTITRIIHRLYCEEISYSQVNEAVGVLECAKLELYRKVAAPYEDEKIKENGDV